MKKLLLFLLLANTSILAQSPLSIVKGHIYNGINNESIPYAVVVLKGGQNTFNTTSDSVGNYLFEIPASGLFNLDVIMS